MAQRDLQPNTETTKRQPVQHPDAQIRLVFERFQAFVDEYRSRISLGGVFVATSQPKAVGTTISCEFKLADGYRLCQAFGEVLWFRPQSTAPDRPAGMGIRFRAIDDEGRKLILRILEEQLKSGGEPFEVERLPSDAESMAAAPAPAPSPRENPASTLVREASPPAPQEDPASTHSRLSAPPAVEPVESVGALEAPEPAGDGKTFDVVQPVDVTSSEPVERPAPDFNAPWGSRLPEIPDEVIEPVDEQELLATAHEVFSSDATEAGFSSTPDEDLFDLDELDPDVGAPELMAPSEVPAFSDSESPKLETPAEPELGSPPEAPDFSSSAEAQPIDFELDEGDVDVPLSSEPFAAGPSQVELDDTLARQLPDDGGPGLGRQPAPEPSLTAETRGEAPGAEAPGAEAPGAEAFGVEGVNEPLDPSHSVVDEPAAGPSFSDVDEPLTSSLPELSAAEAPSLASPESSFEAADVADSTPPVPGDGAADPAKAQEQSHGAEHLIDMISQEEAWEDSDADEEWEDREVGHGLKGWLRDLQLTVSEAKGRILAVVLVLVAVGAGLVFKEQILGLAGLGASPVSTSAPAADASSTAPAGVGPAEPEMPAVEANLPPDSFGADVADSSAEKVDGAAPPPAVRGPDEGPAPSSSPSAVPPAPQRQTSRDRRAVSGVAATRIDDIRFAQTPDATEVVILFDGDLSADRYEYNVLGYDALKEQIIVHGIGLPFRSKIDVGTLELDRIRTGLHGNRLNLVFDLSSELMTLKHVRPLGDRLEVVVGRR